MSKTPEELQAEVDQLTAKLADSTSQLTASESKLTEAQTESRDLKTREATLSVENRSLNKQLEELPTLKTQLEAVEQERDTAKTSLIGFEKTQLDSRKETLAKRLGRKAEEFKTASKEDLETLEKFFAGKETPKGKVPPKDDDTDSGDAGGDDSGGSGDTKPPDFKNARARIRYALEYGDPLLTKRGSASPVK